jgi:hypothetical protein
MAKQPPRVFVDSDNLINEYLSGKSIKQLATDIGHSRQVVYRILRNAGITPRNRSEAMYVRMAQTSPEERQRLSEAAHEAKRGYVNSPETRHKMALAKNKRVGIFEDSFVNALSAADIPVLPQQPFLAYNLDIGCGNVAVEIEVAHGNPLRIAKTFKRIMDCLNAGMNMIYVSVPSKASIIPDLCYKQVVSLVKECRRNPPLRCKYWMIRSTGEIYASGTSYPD